LYSDVQHVIAVSSVVAAVRASHRRTDATEGLIVRTEVMKPTAVSLCYAAFTPAQQVARNKLRAT